MWSLPETNAPTVGSDANPFVEAMPKVEVMPKVEAMPTVVPSESPRNVRRVVGRVDGLLDGHLESMNLGGCMVAVLRNVWAGSSLSCRVTFSHKTSSHFMPAVSCEASSLGKPMLFSRAIVISVWP